MVQGEVAHCSRAFPGGNAMPRLFVLIFVGLALAGCGLPLLDNPTPFHCVKYGARTATCT